MTLTNTYDPRTLMFAYIFVRATVTAGLLTSIRAYNKDFLKIITLGMFVGTVGFMLVLDQGVINDFWSIYVANLFIVLGFYIEAIGILRVAHIKVKLFSLNVMIIFHALIFFIYTFIDFDTNARIFFLASEMIIPSTYIIIRFFNRYKKNKSTLDMAMIFTYFLYLITNLVRLFNAALDNGIEELFRQSVVLEFTLLIYICAVVSMSFAVLLSLAREYQMELLVKNSELEELSLTDHLTGIYNKRALMKKLREEISRAHRNKTSTVIGLIDLDYFKKVNDQYGHVFGDEVLKRFTAFIDDHLREYDIIGRYGGEEFLVMLPQTGIENALHIFERMRAEVEKLDWNVPGLVITFSGGVLEINEYNDRNEIRYLIDQADKALYKAKENGRNRIERV
jgi:diguanylate cyclase (GGDEF)-like protein